jgi:AAHS family 3-hydroxyphenylpropionic acid transporter
LGGSAPLIAVPVIHYLLPDSREFALLERPAAHGWWHVVFGEGRARPSVLLWISFFSTLMVLYLLLNWLPALLNSRGFSRPDVFLVQMGFNGGGIPGSILAGILMDGARRKVSIPLVYSGLVMLLILMAVMPTQLWVALLCGAVLGGFVMGSQSMLYGIAPDCYGTAIRGTGVGAAVFAGRTGSVVGPMLAAGLVGAGRSAGEVLMAIVPFAIVGGLSAVALTTQLRK